jgi:hypothetical protein
VELILPVRSGCATIIKIHYLLYVYVQLVLIPRKNKRLFQQMLACAPRVVGEDWVRTLNVLLLSFGYSFVLCPHVFGFRRVK